MKHWVSYSSLLLGLLSAPAFAAPFFEAGDAGDTFATAQAVTGGPYSGITANVGEGSDTRDFFLFSLLGGNYEINFACETPCDTVSVKARLYDGGQGLLFTLDPLPNVEAISLSAGNYFLELSAAADPIIAVEFLLIGTLLTLSAPIPEPATMALFALGLAGLGFSRRKAQV